MQPGYLLDSLRREIGISLKPHTPFSNSCDVINSSSDCGITDNKPSCIAFTCKEYNLETLMFAYKEAHIIQNVVTGNTRYRRYYGWEIESLLHLINGFHHSCFPHKLTVFKMIIIIYLYLTSFIFHINHTTIAKHSGEVKVTCIKFREIVFANYFNVVYKKGYRS